MTSEIDRLFQEAIRFHQRGQLAQSEEIYRHILRLDENNADAWHLIGVIAHQTGQHELAVESIRKAITLKPDHDAHYLVNLGSALQAQGEYDAAIDSYRQALALDPHNHLVYNNWGATLRIMGRFDEAVDCFEQSLRIFPDNPDALTNLGTTLKELNRLDEAVAFLERSLALKPSSHAACYNLAKTFELQGDTDKAMVYHRKAITIKPDFHKAHFNLGLLMIEQGLLGDGLEHYRWAVQNLPDSPTDHQNLLVFLNYSNIGLADIFAEHLRWGERHAARHTVDIPPYLNNRNPNRRLRIGYVSPDFRLHAVALFAEPILANHDKSQVEIFCYAEVTEPDNVTARFQQYADHWHSTIGMSDEAAAQLIRSHRIDILVDLAGHTRNNRLLVFAFKPAPVQMTYLGYPNTSGLATMDYRITDRHADPEGVADTYYCERLLRLPGSLCCYRAAADMPDTSPLPALANGYLTFGSFNNFNKIDQNSLALWAELLRAIPSARLMILTVPEGEIRRRLLRSFAELGISAQRLELHGKLPVAEFHRKFLEVDIALDPLSVSGGTTTCESLWMGVPVIVLVGERFITRVSYSFLYTAGLADFAAFSPDDYIRIACHLASDLPLLAEIRAGLRTHLATSPLTDELAFTRNLETLYREVWVKWCSAT